MNTLLIASIPGAYFNAVLICFFILMFRQHGLVFSPTKATKLLWPVLKALLIGFIPAVILGSIVVSLSPNLGIMRLVLPALGALISAVVLHRFLLGEVEKTKLWNIAIAVITIAMLVLCAVTLNALEAGDWDFKPRLT